MEYGTIRIKLDELLKASGLSKNMLSHRAEMQRTQINNYCKNQHYSFRYRCPRKALYGVELWDWRSIRESLNKSSAAGQRIFFASHAE